VSELREECDVSKSKRISKRVREEAILACQLQASGWKFGECVEPEFDRDVDDLRFAAWLHVHRAWSYGEPCGLNWPEAYAEAAVILAEGWSPT
jgi:hypothetical protein